MVTVYLPASSFTSFLDVQLVKLIRAIQPAIRTFLFMVLNKIGAIKRVELYNLLVLKAIRFDDLTVLLVFWKLVFLLNSILQLRISESNRTLNQILKTEYLM